ncbi:DDB1- and CUL4-associated factor 15 isoform X4 [Anthonomus grandis grandis]|uniref:DDB1- and CUL4-associated factor 15 isoform X4 n=1 Tax=Anthonomus grandis grandis TaxID=2921223 RepID=UPI002165C65F|nr:DDB1- and CUL4-associated factor 15 isoform X4 [Anthonomus grandis grandis]
MASLTSEDESSDDGYSISSSNSTDYTTFGQNSDNWSFSSTEQNDIFTGAKRRNLVLNIRSRQLYGRFTKHSRARDERIFNNIHHRCRKSLSALLSSHNSRNQIFMGFTLCGQYFLSYTETQNQGNQPHTGRLFLFDASEYKYELHIWRFVPGKKLQLVSKHRIFNHLKCGSVLDKIMFMQFPNDVHKIVCYGHDEASSPDLLHISIITIPSQRSCVHCGDPLHLVRDSGHKPLCIKHGFVVDYMFALSEPAPVFNPRISLSYPDYLVVNTGHHIHILNVSIQNPNQPNQNVSGQSNSSLLSSFHIKDEEPVKFSNFFFNNDAFSEASETASDHCGAVDAILDNFSEYELDSAESDSGRCNATTGLLILDPKGEPPVSTPKWITKVVRRYSNGDFENSSLLSGQSRDDYNIPIEVPLLVQGLTEQHFEIVPDYITTTNLTDHRSNGGERHILVTQRSMDCEQFVQRRAQALCSECNLEFMHCADYDIKVIYVCPISGEILCKALIKLGALKRSDPNAIVENYYAHFLFTWNIETDDFDIIDSSAKDEKLLAGNIPPTTGSINVPEIHCSGVWVLSYDTSKPSKAYLRDPKEHFEVFLGTPGSEFHWRFDDTDNIFFSD